MTARSRRSGARVLLAVAAGVVSLLANGRAEAQFGIPGGFWFQPAPPPSITYLNQRALLQGQAAAANRPRGLVNPHAEASSGRDVDYYEKYDPATRRRIEQRVLRQPSPGDPGYVPPKPRTPAAPTPPPAPSLSNFFLKDALQWPADAPASGDFALKRTNCNDAVARVLTEVKTQGHATIASANDARARLLDYGRPALKYIREQSSHSIAEAFNSFLMSLYDSIGQAATPRTS